MLTQKQKAAKQILEEFQELNYNPLPNIGVSVGLVNNNIFEWQVGMFGPVDTPFKDGLFLLKIKFPDNYPESPPLVCFITPIYHINVNHIYRNDCPLGYLCYSTLFLWKPEYKMRQVLAEIFICFYLQNPRSPTGLERANEMIKNPELYEKKIKYFTKKYANPLKPIIVEDRNWDFSFS